MTEAIVLSNNKKGGFGPLSKINLMQLPKATTVTEKYLEAIYKELRKMNGKGSYEVNMKKEPPEIKKKAEPVEMKGLERLTCDICGKKFKTEASLKAHKTKVHK